ncbi:MAG: hypothetical protein QOE55_4732 [Acidobacteriaceae bacterium]|nr:hypothetical protein [Acidobacteriaceae bacterium]
MAPSIPVAVAATTTATSTAAVLPSTATAATTSALFGAVATLAVDRAVPTGFERHRGGLATTGTNHGCARAHAAARAVTTLVLGMGRSVTPAPAGALFSLTARFTAPGRGVAAFLEKLLFTSSENKFLSAVATG